MILKLCVTNSKATPIKYWPKVKALARRKVFQFKPGLNVLIGPNGSGKSTMLKALATLCHCRQGGIPKITQSSVSDFMGWDGHKRPLLQGMEAVTDGQPVCYFNPETTPGITDGAFDYDFFGSDTMSMFMTKGSSGQTTMMRLGRIIETALHTNCSIDDRLGNQINDIWVEAKKVSMRSYEPRIEAGQRTILLDEPERSLDLPSQVLLWRLLLKYSPTVQLIVASHNPLAFGLAAANYIELEKGYKKTCEDALAMIRAGVAGPPASAV